MHDAQHQGKIIQTYRSLRQGLSQEELGQRIGRSRRTIVTIEQSAYIHDAKLRRTLAWALHIPHELLDLPENTIVDMPIFHPIEESLVKDARPLGRTFFETFTENLRMRLNLYYLGSAIAADENLNIHIKRLTQMVKTCHSKDLHHLQALVSHNYQVKGLIARDQLDFEVAQQCFQQASLFAQQGNNPDLNALAMGRLAVVHILQKHMDQASQLYETARDISKHSPASLRAYLAIGHAEVRGKLGDNKCLKILAEARSLAGHIDPEDDDLLLLHSTRCSERSVDDCWARCHALIGMPMIALDHYDRLEKALDLNMTRMRARLQIQYAEALYSDKDLSCCFYLTEGWKLACATNSKLNTHRIQDFARKLALSHPRDVRVKDLLQLVQG